MHEVDEDSPETHQADDGFAQDGFLIQGEMLQDFLDVCLQDTGIVEDWFDMDEADHDAQDGSRPDENADISAFAMNDSDSDADSENMELNDAYTFDSDQMAQLLNAGASHDELVEVAQGGMARAFEERMLDVGFVEVHCPGEGPRKSQCAPAPAPKGRARRPSGGGGLKLFGRALAGLGCSRRKGRADSKLAEAPAVTAPDEGRPNVGHLSAAMTPEAATPEAGTSPRSGACPSGTMLAAEMLAARLEEHRTSRHIGRRSSIRRGSIEHVVQRQVEMRRQGISKQVVAAASAAVAAGADGTCEDELRERIRIASRRHRLSIEKARDVLDAADVDVDEHATQEKLRLVQSAIAEACRRHRKSISEAVQQTLETDAQEQDQQPEQPQQQPEPLQMEQLPQPASAQPWQPKHPQLPDEAQASSHTSAELSLQDRIQQSVRAAYDRRIGQPVVAPRTVIPQSGQGPVWSPDAPCGLGQH